MEQDLIFLLAGVTILSAIHTRFKEFCIIDTENESNIVGYTALGISSGVSVHKR